MSDRPSDSDLKLELKDVVLAVKEVAEWYDLGLQLGLPDSTLALIAQHPDYEGHRRMMLSKWLQSDTEASWEKLAKALDAIDKRVVAANIRRKYLGVVPAQSTQLQQEDDLKRQAMTEKALRKTKSRFSNLLLKVRSSMEANKIKVKDVRQFLVTYFEGECNIPEGCNLTKTFDCVTFAKLWRYDHYGPLEELAESFLPDDDPARALMTKYITQLSAFYATTRIIDFIKISEDDDLEEDNQMFSPKKYNRKYRKLTLKLKLQKNISELTLDFVHELWEALRKEFTLPSLTAVIDKIIEGSLTITWLVLPHVVEKIKAKFSKSLQFFQHHGIVSIGLYGGDLELPLYDEKMMEGSTPLFRACFSGDSEAVEDLLEGGANINQQNDNDDGDTPLIGASQNGHVHIVRMLLSRGAKVDHLNKIGDSALLVTSSYGHSDVGVALLEHGATVDLQNDAGVTALIYACLYGNTDIARMLLDHGAVIDLCDKENGWSALMSASSTGHPEMVKLLLERGATVDLTDKDGMTALIFACLYGNTDVARMLLDHGAVIDLCDKENGWSALMSASVGGHPEMVKLLLERGATVDLTDEEDGITALYCASAAGHTSTARVLLQHGAVVDHKSNDGISPLYVASQEGHPDTATLLIDLGASVDLPVDDEDGDTPLCVACNKGHAETAEVLLDKGAFIDFQDKKGRSPLHLACVGGHEGTVKVLLERKAQVDLQNENGATALSYASVLGHTSTARVLLQHGAVVDHKANDGRTALYAASQEGHHDTAALLIDLGATVDLPCDDEHGATPLCVACNKGHAETAEVLLDKGAFIDFQDKKGRSPLLVACMGGHEGTVKVLLERKAQVDLQNEDGWTALFFASRRGLVELVKLLLDHGASVNIKSNSGLTAFDVAESESQQAVCQLLAEYSQQKVKVVTQESAPSHQATESPVQQPETKTGPTEQQREELRSVGEQIWDLFKRTFLGELVKKEEQTSQHGGEGTTRHITGRPKGSRSFLNRLWPWGRRRRRQVVGTAPAPER